MNGRPLPTGGPLGHQAASAGRPYQSHRGRCRALGHRVPPLCDDKEGYGTDACCALVQALLAHEDVAARGEIEAALAQACAWLGESGAEALRPRVLEARAALARAAGDAASSESDLAEALRLYRAMGADRHAARLAGAA